ncbi:arsenate reductase family protein [uncultured Ruthenibacterium sp.]|uniref:arsenate reductase family protein n=1 Tax=uncultured Ruthenibacterium sp. TaxID=1905347 RepID=UPI00349EB96A
MLLIWYPKCTTCQRAKKWLDEKGFSYQLRDIKEENPLQEELKEWYSKSGIPLKRFFNTSGLLYKGMGLKEKLPTMDDEEKIALLSEYGMLVKRPILIEKDCILIGFKEAEWSAALNK